MYKENSVIKNAAERLRQAFMAAEPEATEVQGAFESYAEAIAQTVREDYESANGDQAILMQRGFRVLTSEEKKFYEAFIEAGKQKAVQTMNGLLSDKVMPVTIIEDVYKDLTEEHPLLARINFQSVEYLTRWILNDHSAQTAAWGEINSAVTQQITSAFRVIEITQCKLSAYAMIELDMLDLGPTFLDNYIRTFLKESIAAALEEAIVCGNGLNRPIGLDRDISQGVTVSTSTGYPQKTATSIASFMPKDYGPVLAELAVSEVWYTEDSTGDIADAATAANSDGSAKSGYTKHGGRMRKFDEVTLICNQVDFLTKIMPATTALTANGTYAKDIFPFPTEVIRSNAMATGKAIVCLPEEYFMGIGTSKDGTITFSDEYKFLEDQRYFKIKMHGMGKAYDNTVAVLLDISALEEAYIMIKAAEVTA